MTLERNWIDRLQARWPQVDLRHDTFYDENTRQILTTDMMVEGVHFCWDYFYPQDLGWKSIAVNLSDIAATGGVPQWILVSIGVPANSSLERLEGIYHGIEECCRRYHCKVVGGDTVRADKTSICVTAVGTLPPRSIPGRRNRANAGDIVAVSGSHGLSRAGLEALQKNLPGFSQAKQAHLRPTPQLRLGKQVAQVLPRYAMMDSSDGLADAAIRFAEASNVDVVLDLKRITLHPEVAEIALQAECDPLDWTLYGGEDFQLVVCLPRETLGLFPELHPIGYVQHCTQPDSPQAFLKDGTAMTRLSGEKTFQHFTEISKTPVPPAQELND